MVKKIDFHIHTVSSIKDSGFKFSMDWLRRYVSSTSLDAIAITNHDLFDKTNYYEIVKNLSGVRVFPGMEISLDVGHVNIIFPENCVDDLVEFSNWLGSKHISQTGFITCEELCENLVCWEMGIYIFELGKSKGVKEIPKLFDHVVSVGGVTNQLRFNMVKYNTDNLVPCLFSDAHATDNDPDSRNDIEKLKNKQTYIQVDSCDFEDVRRCLRDRSKISITKENLRDVINIGGVNLSTGLNLVVGKRGTGKTHFLNKIKEEYSDDEYYEIKQFETARADEYIEKQRKEQGIDALNIWQEKYKNEFLKIKDYLKSDDGELENLEAYLSDVKSFSEQIARSKSSQKYSIFKEVEFELANTKFLANALKNINEVIETEEIWLLLFNGYQKRNNFIEVYSELRKKYLSIKKDNEIKSTVNHIMTEVKSTVTARTGISNIQECSINKVIHKIQLEKKINEFLRCIIKDTSLRNERLHGYQIQVNVAPYETANQFRQEIKTNEAVNSDLMEAYKNKDYISFLNNLKRKNFYNEANFAEYLVCKEVKLLDSDGIPASGGQAVGFALMLRLNEAKNKQVILIDEPESSLDNAYIRSELNSVLKELAINSMVVVITHNSTLGTLLNPDYLIITSKNDKGAYSIMSGEFSSTKVIDSKNHKEENSHDKFIEAMESGLVAFNKKGEIYANLKF